VRVDDTVESLEAFFELVDDKTQKQEMIEQLTKLEFTTKRGFSFFPFLQQHLLIIKNNRINVVCMFFLLVVIVVVYLVYSVITDRIGKRMKNRM